MSELALNVTYHLPQSRVSNALTHVRLNTINGVLGLWVSHYLSHLVCVTI